MSEVDTAQEWRRLREIYAGMTDDELQIVAEEGYQLTDVAKQALEGEISYRGLKITLGLEPEAHDEPQPMGDEGFDPANLDLVPGFGVENNAQATWVKKTLNDAGVPCYFGPELTEDVQGLNFPDEFGVQVWVLRSDLNRVHHVLRTFDEQFPSDSANDEELGEAPVRCPKCRSTEVVFESLDSELPEGDVRRAKFNWHCDACGWEWQDDGVGTPT